MAQKVQVLLMCDLHDDEVEGKETVAFGLDGASYEIDLCEEHADSLRDSFASYVGAARKAKSDGQPRRGGGSRGGRQSAERGERAEGGRGKTAEMREWARANGHQVNDRGRIPSSVVQAYEAAH